MEFSQPAGLPQVGIRLDPQSKITEKPNPELKVYEDSLADSAGNKLASATNLSIPIVNAESGVINLDENISFAPHSDGQPLSILGMIVIII